MGRECVSAIAFASAAVPAVLGVVPAALAELRVSSVCACVWSVRVNVGVESWDLYQSDCLVN